MDIFATAHTSVQYSVASPVRYTGWRCLHQVEGGYANLPNPTKDPPEVRPSVDARPIEFTKEMQLLTNALMTRFNPFLTQSQKSKVFNTDRAFSNNQGFGEVPDRANWFENNDQENYGKDLPKLMKAIICGGMFLPYATKEAGNIVCKPGRDGINAFSSLPTVDQVIERNWYYHAVYIRTSDMLPSNFPANGVAVVVPYFLRETVTYPASWFEWWNKSYPPDHLKIGG